MMKTFENLVPLLLALLSAYAFVFGFSFEAGTLVYHKLPAELLYINFEVICFGFFSSITPFVFSLVFTEIYVNCIKTRSHKEDIYLGFLFVFIGLYSIAIFGILHGALAWLTLATILILLVKLLDRIPPRESFVGLSIPALVKQRRWLYLSLLLIIGVLFSSLTGYTAAKYRSDFLLYKENGKDWMLVKKNGDNFILQEYDTNKDVFIRNYLVRTAPLDLTYYKL